MTTTEEYGNFVVKATGTGYLPHLGNHGSAVTELQCPKCKFTFACPPLHPQLTCPHCEYTRIFPLTGCHDQCGDYAARGCESTRGWRWLEFSRAWRCPRCVRQLMEANRYAQA